jgi:hypothetical protein
MFRLMLAILNPIPGIQFPICCTQNIPRIDHLIIQYLEHLKVQPTVWFSTQYDFKSTN